MPAAPPRRPGVYVRRDDTQPMRGLPPMDVAAFVGFADRGPLDAPVLVESVGSYYDIFGKHPPALAWDATRGQLVRAHLGPAVQDFFSNGGQRCWVVRVAGRGADVAEYELPGLHTRTEAGVAPTLARARCVGAWANELEVGTTLQCESVRHAEWRAPDLADSELRMYVTGWGAAIVPWDLIELTFEMGAESWVWLQFASTVETSPEGTMLRLPVGEPNAGTWFALYDQDGSPPSDEGNHVRYHELPMSSTRETLEALFGNTSPPVSSSPDDASAPQSAALPRIRRLRFTLRAHDPDEPSRQITDLGFHPRHARYWRHLPDDARLYFRRGPAPPPRRALDLVLEPLYADAAYPRFPLAGTRHDAPSVELPIDRDGRSMAERNSTEPAALSRHGTDGLTTFSWRLFVDERLAHAASSSVMRLGQALSDQAAEAVKNVGDASAGDTIRPRALHALLPLRDVSMIAVPDAPHWRWGTNLEHPVGGDDIDAPTWLRIERVDGRIERYRMTWTSTGDACRYVLEWSAGADFSQPALLYRGDEPGGIFEFSPDCARHRYFRVRSECYGRVTAWSIAVGVPTRSGTLTDCDAPRLGSLSIAWDRAERVSWTAYRELGPLASGGIADGPYEVHEADNLMFGGTVAATILTGNSLELELQRTRRSFYRVRAVHADRRGPWSNTVAVDPNRLPQVTLAPKPTATVDPFAEAGDLLSVHRAVLRFCHARADVVALLSLPRQLETHDLPGYRTALTSTPGGVRPLTIGESPALGYGAVFVPWIRNTREVGGIGSIPPDGVLAGTLAAQSLAGGAWLAVPARRLNNTLALDPPISDLMWNILADAGLNAIMSTSRGFSLLGDHTLSLDESTRPLHVRRLLILLRRIAMRAGEVYVFEENSTRLRRRVQRRFESILSDLYQRGAFAGDRPGDGFRVSTGPSANTPGERELGRFLVELAVAPARPLEFLYVQLVQNNANAIGVQEV